MDFIITLVVVNSNCLKEESSRSLLFSCEGDAGGAIALLSSLSLRSEPERGAYYFEAFVKGLNLLLDYL
ncbi:hypothetical protein BM1_07352 [Bipolaris maydis]|nr:hypothetical protein BM1_07352 [Bipolaris maydis]